MIDAAEALRLEIKRRWGAQEVRQLAIFQAWIRAAEYLESLERKPYLEEREVLAEALRADNIRGHPDDGWDSVNDQGKDLWREKAHRVQKELAKAARRQSA